MLISRISVFRLVVRRAGIRDRLSVGDEMRDDGPGGPARGREILGLPRDLPDGRAVSHAAHALPALPRIAPRPHGPMNLTPGMAAMRETSSS